jgi:transglutaminase-like putative cysteine protease
MQQSLALAMLVLEAAVIGYLSGTLVLPVLCVGAALAGVIADLQFRMERQRIYDIMALVAVGFLIKHLLTPDNPRYEGLFNSQPLALIVAEYTLAMQVFQFYVQRKDGRLPFLFPGTGVVALTCAAIVEVDALQQRNYLFSCLIFAVLAVCYCSSSRRMVIASRTRRDLGRSGAQVLVLAVIVLLGAKSAAALYRYERDLDELVGRWLMPHLDLQRPGLAESAPLGSVNLRKQQQAMEIALRVRSASRPDYFRGRAYDIFDGRQWLPVIRGQTRSWRSLPEGRRETRHGGNAFLVGQSLPDEDASLVQYEVWPNASLSGTFASPLHPVWLQTHADLITVDSHSIIRSDDSFAGAPYTVDILSPPEASDPWFDDEDFLRTLSAAPKQADEYPAIRELADRLFADCRTNREKIDAAVDYFLSNYSYSLQVDVPEKWHSAPVAWFLLEQPDAHCEFFASGAAVLLRLGGVPCRYVTGFVVHEQNQFSHEWIARNRDAHAWVEAWDPDQGWVTVEATAGGGVPANPAVSAATQFREFLATRFQQLRIEWQRKGLRGLIFAALRRLLTPAGLSLLAVVALIVLFVARRRLANLLCWKREPIDERTRAFHTVLLKVDRVVKRLGFERLPQQTIDAFADSLVRESACEHTTSHRVAGVEERGTSDEPPVRTSPTGGSLHSTPVTPGREEREPGTDSTHESLLTDVADWYRQYARLRYGRSSDDTLEELATLANRLVMELRR